MIRWLAGLGVVLVTWMSPFGFAASVGWASVPPGFNWNLGVYWQVTRNGGVYPQPNKGDVSTIRLSAPVVDMAPTADGAGYWLVAGDGGIFTFGDATFHGSLAGTRLNGPAVGVTSTKSQNGYWIDGSDGGVFTFGDAQFFGSHAAATGSVVGPLVATPDQGGYWLASAALNAGASGFGDASPGCPPLFIFGNPVSVPPPSAVGSAMGAIFNGAVACPVA